MTYLNVHPEADLLHKEAQVASSIARFDEAENLFDRALGAIQGHYREKDGSVSLQGARILRDRALLCGRRALILAEGPEEAVVPLREACTLAEEARDQISYIYDLAGTSEVSGELAHSISTLGGLVLAREVCIAPRSPTAAEAVSHHEEAEQVFMLDGPHNSYFRTLNLVRLSRALLIERRPYASSRQRAKAVRTAAQAFTQDSGNFRQAITVIDTRFKDLDSRDTAIASIMRGTPHPRTEEVVNI